MASGRPDPLSSVAIEGNAALGTLSMLDIGESIWERARKSSAGGKKNQE